jgi:3-hydroxyisobutyrate dehydrogenase-like beta-hydroxyacid dehydrogenase
MGKETVMNVGFIGLGHMGSGMAARLLQAGHRLTAYNRTPARAAALVAQGARTAATVAEACRGDAVVTMLANDEAVEEVVFGSGGVVSSLAVGALHISSSTISVDLARRLATVHSEHGQRFVSAPVFGRPDAAAAGKLYIVVAGDASARAAATPLLSAIGQSTFAISENPEAANLVKLSGNFLTATVIESLGEALALISRGGIDRKAYLEFLTSTNFNAPVFRIFGHLILEGQFSQAGFAAGLAEKDIRLLLAASEHLRVPMPVASVVHDRFLSLLARGGEQLDWSAVGGLAVADAGADAALTRQLAAAGAQLQAR